MKIAIYARKSRLSDKGESINNQIDACKNYILNWSGINHVDAEFIIYKDEGFSGGNTDRPEFQRLMADVKSNKYSKLICYRLDRVSRNIADFSNTYELLNKHNIEFVSVKEQFDTSTPIGRAMLNIAMVFAQLERETIAERIRDNMLALAKTGRWLGGKPPTGFASKQIAYEGAVNDKKMYMLELVEAEMKTVRLIFDKFYELKSLRGVESFLIINDILSPNECNYTASTIRDILTNPVYAAADMDTYAYFQSLGSQICNDQSQFNSTHGLMVYNKTNQGKDKSDIKDPSEWVVSIGKHEAIIPGSKWVYIQQLLKQNTSKQFYNKEAMNYGILSGLIKCKACGSTMKVKKGKINAAGEQAFVYICSTKDISRKTKCNSKNIIGQDADKDILEYLINMSKDDSFINKIIDSNEITCTSNATHNASRTVEVEKAINENINAINNLMSQMAQLEHTSTLLPHFMSQLKILDEEKQNLNKQLESLKENIQQNNATALNLKIVKDTLNALANLDESASVQEIRALIRTVVEKIEWDGRSLEVELFGQTRLETL